MEYIKDSDLSYILNKYHDASAPWTGLKRFVPANAPFDPQTGKDPKVICEMILAQDATLADLPRPIRKARALVLVLENTRIAADPRDPYPAIQCMDRPLTKTLVDKRVVAHRIAPEAEAARRAMEKSGAATIWLDYDHSVPVWERIFSLGFPGLLQGVKEARADHEAAGTLTAEAAAMFDSVILAYEGILIFIDRLIAQAMQTAGCQRQAAALRKLRSGTPDTLYEALLLSYLYFMISEHIDHMQVRSLGQMDKLFRPYFERDLARGVSEEELRREWAYYFLQFAAIGNYWNQPMFLGGNDENEQTEICPLSYLILDVYDRMGIYTPKIQIKYNKETPDALLQKALDMIRRGHNSIVFVSDARIRRVLMQEGADADTARTANIRGCYEFDIAGGMNMGMNYVNLLKPLEYAMHEGLDGRTGAPDGLPCPAEFDSFEAFLAEYKRQLKNLLQKVMSLTNTLDCLLTEINPTLLLTATSRTALEHAKDPLAGGAASKNSCINLGGTATVTDSLCAIRRLVFESKEMTLQELRSVLDSNFEGQEPLRRRLLAGEEKFGNGQERPDALALDILSFAAEIVNATPNAVTRGGRWHMGTHVARQIFDQGAKSIATPDGRLAFSEYSKNLSPVQGQAKNGVTAAILSVVKFPTEVIASDACLDAALHPTTVQGADGLAAILGLLRAFDSLGGHAIHFNVLDTSTLRAAQEHPEQYADLQIRVSGWNALFNSMSKSEQDAYILQAEAAN